MSGGRGRDANKGAEMQIKTKLLQIPISQDLALNSELLSSTIRQVKNKVWKMSFARRSEYDLEFFEATLEERANRVWLQPVGSENR